MVYDGLTAKDIENIYDCKASVRYLLKCNARIEANDPGAGNDWSYIHTGRRRVTYDAAIYAWFVERDVPRAREYLRMGGESALLTMRDFWQDIKPIRMAYVDGKCFTLAENRDGTWSHRSGKTQKMLENRIPDMNAIEEDLMPDLSKPFVFVMAYFRLSEHAIPGMECALCSGDIELARQVAEYAGTLGDLCFGKTLAYYSRMLKYAILGDAKRFDKSFDGLEKAPKKAPYQELGRAYRAVMAEDAQEAEDMFGRYVKWFGKQRSKMKPYRLVDAETGEVDEFERVPDEYYLAFPGLAFCNFAASRGIPLNVDEPFLPKELCRTAV